MGLEPRIEGDVLDDDALQRYSSSGLPKNAQMCRSAPSSDPPNRIAWSIGLEGAIGLLFEQTGLKRGPVCLRRERGV
jgi:hypothetical protein